MNSEHALDIALLILRLGLGLALFAHGTQKLFGWFGGGGIAGTGAGMESMGFRPGKINALLAGLGEAGGGLLLALGLFTPLGGAAVASTMIVAGSTHTANGFFAGKGGFELPGFFGLTAVALTLSGPGQYSIDGALDNQLVEPWIGITALVVGVLAALILVARQRAWVKANA